MMVKLVGGKKVILKREVGGPGKTVWRTFESESGCGEAEKRM